MAKAVSYGLEWSRGQSGYDMVTVEKGNTMEKKRTFSTMEILLVGVFVGSLLLSFLQSKREEQNKEKKTGLYTQAGLLKDAVP
jgi:hypothetical protein